MVDVAGTEHAPGVVQKDSAVVRVGLAMAVMDKWVLRTIIHASLQVNNKMIGYTHEIKE